MQGHVRPDHVHLLLSAPPHLAPSRVPFAVALSDRHVRPQAASQDQGGSAPPQFLSPPGSSAAMSDVLDAAKQHQTRALCALGRSVTCRRGNTPDSSRSV